MLFETCIARAVRRCSTLVALTALLGPTLMAQAPPSALQITILDGEDAVNNIRQRTAREPIVQVEDENHKPIAGAAVIFLLPNDGAGGTFAGGARTLTAMTDSKGQAIARGLRPNRIAGRYQIRVQASYQGQTAQAQINQTNVGGASAAGSHAFPKWIAVVAAVAVAGTVAAVVTHGGSSPTNVPVTVTAGSGSVGGPR